MPAMEERGGMAAMISRGFIWLCLLLAMAGAPARAAPVPYYIDQRYATIGFTTSGLFNTQGYFQKFTGHLMLDFQAPENSTVDVTVSAQAITLSWPQGVQMLESPAYFDAKDFPQILFHSISIERTSNPGHYEILGALTIRGVTRPQMMVATLLSAAAGSQNAGTADFYVTGTLHRSAFGMVADQAVVNDAVVLQIHARVMLAK
jgi:polyisoprenoid-binding protein YceI